MTESQPEYLAPEDFAILPWGGTPGDPQVLADIRRCGFNLAGFVRPADLDLVKAAGLKAIVSDESLHVTDAAAALPQEEIERRLANVTQPIKGHPALYGYYLRDEPAASVYPGLARWSKALAAADPKARAYINLFPNYATPVQLGAATYQEYVDQFLETVAPPFLSYDHYALMESGVLRKSYFENLEVVRAAAQRQSIPFWNIVLANSHFTYAEPSPAGFRFQVYTTLAYGARGISYFTYFTPDSGNYRLAPIHPTGDKTPTWEMLRQVNLQIHALGPVYLGLKSLNVFHTANVPEGSLGTESSLLLDEISGGALLVGEFKNGHGQPYVMVVNKDLQRSTSFEIRFKGKGQLQRTSPYTGRSGGWRRGQLAGGGAGCTAQPGLISSNHLMGKPPATDSAQITIPIMRFLQVEECPPEWRSFDLYCFRDAQVVFYVGQSHLAFVRVWEHIVQGYKARSVVGRFILANWPYSMKFNIDLMSSSSSRFALLGNAINAAERSLIEQFAPCFNETMNPAPTSVPAQYRPYNAPLRCSRNIKRLMRDAGYIIKAEDKKAWLSGGTFS